MPDIVRLADKPDKHELRRLLACWLANQPRTGAAPAPPSHSLLEVLAAAPRPATLEELDLSDSATSNADVDWLLQHGDRFRSLRRLIVERTAIDAAGAERLRMLGPEIVHSTADAPRYRYVVGQE